MSEQNASETSMIGSATEGTEPSPANPEAAPDPTPPTEGASPSTEGVETEGQGSEGNEGAPEAPAPITLEDLSLPEGVELAEEEAGEFLSLLNEGPEDPKERAQAFLDLHLSLLSKAADAYAGQWETTQADWQRQVRELPEIGGDRLEQTLGQIAKVLDRYGDQEVREILNVTGAGNHPAVVRFMHKIAKDLNESPPVRGGSAEGQPRDRASRMYGNN